MAERVSGIQSLARGLVTLELVAKGDVRPSELAEILGVSRPSAYRFLRTLADHGYVRQSPDTKAFRANPAKIFMLANLVRSSSTWLGQAEELIGELARQTGETANLAILDGTEVAYVAAAESEEPLSVRQLVGTKRPLHCSAIGKAILAHLEAEERSALLERAGLPRLTAHTITSVGELESHLDQVRVQGWALDDQETIYGVRCLAAPVLNRHSVPLAAIGVSAPAARLVGDRIPEVCELIMHISQRISQRIWDM